MNPHAHFVRCPPRGRVSAFGRPRGNDVNIFEDKVAVVTGAGGTMGRAVVDTLVSQGCRVAMVDVRAESMQPAAAQYGARVMAVACDIRDAAAVESAHRRIVDAWAPVAILVNNAGVLTNAKIEATTSDSWAGLVPCPVDCAADRSAVVAPLQLRSRNSACFRCSSRATTAG